MNNSVQNKIHSWNRFSGLAWFLLGIIWIILQLPHCLRIRIGKLLGKTVFLLPTPAKYITKANLTLCFPELSAKERHQLAKKNFISLGIAFIESAMAWLLPTKKLTSLYTIHGYEHAERAFKNGKGILLVTPHFACIELVARLISLDKNFGILYRPHKKPWLSHIQHYFRKRRFHHCIRSDQIKNLLKVLKLNKAIIYAYDINKRSKRNILAPFFGIPAISLTTVSDIVRLSQAAVIPMHYFRRDDASGYDIFLSPPLENFPSHSKLHDATRLNAVLEEAIRQKPEQYVWPYNRFKIAPT